MAPAGEHLKAKMPRVYRAIRNAPAAPRHAPRLIEAAEETGFGSRPGAGFFVSRAGNGPPWLLKEIRGRRSRYGACRRASEGENAPRL
ncbi:hypothetical protein, partial [Bacillus sp. IG2]|uniref:hypothetical protein n=1 Tax=Bacillus sp. IG2 TaxID=3075931 RepID=UPI0028FC3023